MLSRGATALVLTGMACNVATQFGPGAPTTGPGYAQGTSYAQDPDLGPGPPPPPLAPASSAGGAASSSAGGCPADLALAVGKRIYNTRWPTAVPRGGVARPDKEVNIAALPSDADAVQRVLALEAKTPGLVPAGFRDQVRTSPRDASLRLTMAQCELENPQTIHRAAQDAALAVLLGADPNVGYQLARKALFIDGVESSSCSRDSDCTGFGPGARCDTKDRNSCRSSAYRTSHTLSLAELEVDEVLGGAFLKRMDPNREIDSLWTFGARHRCGKTLCQFTRSQALDEKTYGIRHIFIYEDVKFRGSVGKAPELTAEEKRCRASTGGGMQGVSLESCLSWCGQGRIADEAACKTRCTANCSK